MILYSKISIVGRYFSLKLKKYLIYSLIFSSLFVIENKSFSEQNEVEYEILDEKNAQMIKDGHIYLENGKFDNLLYGKDALNPYGDDDKDGLLNREELYIYKKNGKKYLGYNSHPLLKDTDGDGFSDFDDADPLKWNITARDMAMFMEITYKDDYFIKKVFFSETPLANNTYDKEHIMVNNELSHFWRHRKSYHHSNGFDANLFEIDTEKFPYLKSVQVFAVRGTNGFADLDDDAVLAVGKTPKQVNSLTQVLDELNVEKGIDNLYITGHSLGGYLAQRANIYSHQKGYAWVKNTYTFCAPKITGSSLQNLVSYGNYLTKMGLATHYRVANDPVISPVGFFEGVINVGNSSHSHGSRSFFEEFISKRKDFIAGERNVMHQTGRVPDKLLNELKFETYVLSDIYNPVVQNSVSIIKGSSLKDNIDKIAFKNVPDCYTLECDKNFKINENTKSVEVSIKYIDNSSDKVNVPVTVVVDKLKLENSFKEFMNLRLKANEFPDRVLTEEEKTAFSEFTKNMVNMKIEDMKKDVESVLKNEKATETEVSNIIEKLNKFNEELTELLKYQYTLKR